METISTFLEDMKMATVEITTIGYQRLVPLGKEGLDILTGTYFNNSHIQF